jgi:hypothetical protein
MMPRYDVWGNMNHLARTCMWQKLSKGSADDHFSKSCELTYPIALPDP